MKLFTDRRFKDIRENVVSSYLIKNECVLVRGALFGDSIARENDKKWIDVLDYASNNDSVSLLYYVRERVQICEIKWLYEAIVNKSINTFIELMNIIKENPHEKYSNKCGYHDNCVGNVWVNLCWAGSLDMFKELYERIYVCEGVVCEDVCGSVCVPDDNLLRHPLYIKKADLYYRIQFRKRLKFVEYIAENYPGEIEELTKISINHSFPDTSGFLVKRGYISIDKFREICDGLIVIGSTDLLIDCYKL